VAGKEAGVCVELLKCRGHPNVQLTHRTTFELEAAERLTPRGDCVACVSCRGGGGCGAEGPGVLFIAAFGLEEPYVATARVYGWSLPMPRGGRMVVRKSGERRNSLMVHASASAAELPAELRRLLSSSFTRCYVLRVTLTGLGDEVDAVDVLPGGVVEDPGDGGGAEALGETG